MTTELELEQTTLGRNLNSLPKACCIANEDRSLVRDDYNSCIKREMLGSIEEHAQQKRRKVEGRLEVRDDSDCSGSLPEHEKVKNCCSVDLTETGACFLGAPGLPATFEGTFDGFNFSNGGTGSNPVRRRNFTAEEDILLESGYAKWGSNWEEIRVWGNFQRSAESLCKRHARIAKTQRTPTPESHDDILTESPPPRPDPSGFQAINSTNIVEGINLGSPPPFKLSSILASSAFNSCNLNEIDDEPLLKAPPQTPSSKKIHDYFPRASSNNNERKMTHCHSQSEAPSPGVYSVSKGSNIFEEALRLSLPKKSVMPSNIPSSAPSSPQRGLESVDNVRKERVAQLEERLRELEKEKDAAQISLESQREEVAALQRKNDALCERFEMLTRATEKLRFGARSHIIKLLATQAKEHAIMKRDQLSKDSLRLGTLKPNHLSCTESWQDGSLVFSLKEKLRKVQEDREEVEKKRKGLQRRRNAAAKAQAQHLSQPVSNAVKSQSPVHFGVASGASELESAKFDGKPATPTKKKTSLLTSSCHGSQPQSLQEKVELVSPLEAYELDETYRCRILALRKEEAEVHQDLANLHIQQQQHLRQLRLAREEDASRFNHVANGAVVVLNNRYMLHNLLGKGGFSEVWKAFDLDNMEWVACKVHTLSESWSDARRQSFVKHVHREYKIHQMVDHHRVVKCLDVFELDRRSFVTILEYCDDGDLEMYLQSCKNIPEREAKCILLQILSALRYLNTGLRTPIIHFDLKPGNILFHQGEAKITDFGLSKIVAYENELALTASQGARDVSSALVAPKDIQLTSQGAGTYWYLPPECFDSRDGAPMISSKVDVWSLGVIFFEMLFGQKPFGNDKSQKSILNESTIMNDAHVLVFPNKPGISQESKDFIKRCLEYRKALRPDVETLCEDPFVNPPPSYPRKANS